MFLNCLCLCLRVYFQFNTVGNFGSVVWSLISQTTQCLGGNYPQILAGKARVLQINCGWESLLNNFLKCI